MVWYSWEASAQLGRPYTLTKSGFVYEYSFYLINFSDTDSPFPRNLRKNNNKSIKKTILSLLTFCKKTDYIEMLSPNLYDQQCWQQWYHFPQCVVPLSFSQHEFLVKFMLRIWFLPLKLYIMPEIDRQELDE